MPTAVNKVLIIKARGHKRDAYPVPLGGFRMKHYPLTKCFRYFFLFILVLTVVHVPVIRKLSSI